MSSAKTLRFATQSLLGVALTWGLAAGRTWEIRADGSGDASSVQAGIDSSAFGDTVLVHPGTYNERISFLGKDIVLRSVSGPEFTTIDGSGGIVVLFTAGESRGAVLAGFTITGGSNGILIENSEPTILANVITGNSGTFAGAAIWCVGEPFDLIPTFRPLIQGNTITFNTATRLAGGIGTWQRMAPEIIDNYIAENEATEGDGGGIYFRALPDDVGGVIRGNVIENNYAGDHGGGFYSASALSGSSIEFEFLLNVVSDNTADGVDMGGNSGGGMWLGAANSWIHHNTIIFNTGNGPTAKYGGGIVVERFGSSVIENNIIAFSKNGGGIGCGGTTTPVIRNNLGWLNIEGDGFGLCEDWWQSDGNIVVDPHFCDAENGDFTLAEDSAAITHLEGPLGAYATPGCGPVPVKNSTWGLIKSKYITKP